MEKEPITSEGLKEIKKELEELKNIKRPKIIEAIAEARAHGDLKENAEYHAAKEEQINIDKKIAKMEDMLTRTVVIDPSTLTHDKVSFGSTVTIVDINSNEELTYTIGSFLDSNPEKGIISFNSPLAKQLLGKQEGDDFTAQLPNGNKDFEIISIEYKPF